MDIKYTTDGRKVVVIDRVNATQYIVQEIFIVDGNETPGGERFVVSSVADTPGETWRKREQRKLQEQCATAKETLLALNKKVRAAQQKASVRAEALVDFVQNSDDEQLQTLKDFFAGNITHFFIEQYGKPVIVTWDDDAIYQLGDWGGRGRASPYVEGIKLITLMGTSKGQLNWRINRYHDGSGNYYTVVPCRSYEEALKAAQKALNAQAEKYVAGEGSFDPDRWDKIEGLQIPYDAKKKLVEETRRTYKVRIETLRKDIRTLESKLMEI